MRRSSRPFDAAGRFGRREFLRGSATILGGLPLAAAVLAACDRAADPSTASGAGASPRPQRPSTWPIYEDAPAIESGLPVERDATLRVYQWREYLYDDVLESFERRFRDANVRIEVESFSSMQEAIARLRKPGSEFDVFFPTIDSLGPLIGARMLRPLNHDYLPNSRNLWKTFRGSGRPFYDRGQRYTVPYTVYSSGIGWRTDLVGRGAEPGAFDNPWDALWNPDHRDRVGVYDDYREAIGLALARDGLTDPDAARASDLARAGDTLVTLVGDLGAGITTNGAYEGLPRGEFVMHQAWSGDIISAIGHQEFGVEAGQLGYWWPMGAEPGAVGCDLTAVCSQGRNPVLAHAFVNHLLDFETAMENFSWNGYQPPMSEATREAFVDPGFRWRGIVPERLLCTVMTPEEFEQGAVLLEPAPDARQLWLDQWQRVTQRAAVGPNRDAAR